MAARVDGVKDAVREEGVTELAVLHSMKGHGATRTVSTIIDARGW